MSFGDKLKQARKEKKLTQKEVADRLGIDDTTISKYENDQSEPDNETLKKLAALYGTSIDFLLGTNGKSTAQKLISYIEAELTNDEIKQRIDFKVDNISLSDEEVDEFVDWVRVHRAMKKQRSAASRGPEL